MALVKQEECHHLDGHRLMEGIGAVLLCHQNQRMARLAGCTCMCHVVVVVVGGLVWGVGRGGGGGEGGRGGEGGCERWQAVSGVLLHLAHDCQQTFQSNTPAVDHKTTPVPCPIWNAESAKIRVRKT
jgi:hypothetical protein